MCEKYEPDVQAQCDCVNCGQPWENHQKPNRLENAIRVLSFQRKPMEGCEMPSDEKLAKILNIEQRAPQMKLTVIVKDRFGGLVPQMIMIDGATPVHKIGQAIVEAVRVQTVNDGTSIVKATIGPDEIYNGG